MRVLDVSCASVTKDVYGSNESECIVGKKWDPGILDPGPFSGQIRKVEARLGKLPKIRKSEIN